MNKNYPMIKPSKEVSLINDEPVFDSPLQVHHDQTPEQIICYGDQASRLLILCVIFAVHLNPFFRRLCLVAEAEIFIIYLL